MLSLTDRMKILTDLGEKGDKSIGSATTKTVNIVLSEEDLRPYSLTAGFQHVWEKLVQLWTVGCYDKSFLDLIGGAIITVLVAVLMSFMIGFCAGYHFPYVAQWALFIMAFPDCLIFIGGGTILLFAYDYSKTRGTHKIVDKLTENLACFGVCKLTKQESKDLKHLVWDRIGYYYHCHSNLVNELALQVLMVELESSVLLNVATKGAHSSSFGYHITLHKKDK